MCARMCKCVCVCARARARVCVLAQNFVLAAKDEVVQFIIVTFSASACYVEREERCAHGVACVPEVCVKTYR